MVLGLVGACCCRVPVSGSPLAAAGWLIVFVCRHRGCYEKKKIVSCSWAVSYFEVSQSGCPCESAPRRGPAHLLTFIMGSQCPGESIPRLISDTGFLRPLNLPEAITLPSEPRPRFVSCYTRPLVVSNCWVGRSRALGFDLVAAAASALTCLF